MGCRIDTQVQEVERTTARGCTSRIHKPCFVFKVCSGDSTRNVPHSCPTHPHPLCHAGHSSPTCCCKELAQHHCRLLWKVMWLNHVSACTTHCDVPELKQLLMDYHQIASQNNVWRNFAIYGRRAGGHIPELCGRGRALAARCPCSSDEFGRLSSEENEIDTGRTHKETEHGSCVLRFQGCAKVNARVVETSRHQLVSHQRRASSQQCHNKVRKHQVSPQRGRFGGTRAYGNAHSRSNHSHHGGQNDHQNKSHKESRL